MTREKSCGALVFHQGVDRVQFLILKHRLGGHWSFPKGHVEAGESERQTALREIKEETGLSVKLLDGFRQRVSYSPRPGVSKEVVYFLGRAPDQNTTMQEEEVSEIIWVDAGKCHEYLSYQNDRLLLSAAKRHLRRRGILRPQGRPQQNG